MYSVSFGCSLVQCPVQPSFGRGLVIKLDSKKRISLFVLHQIYFKKNILIKYITKAWSKQELYNKGINTHTRYNFLYKQEIHTCNYNKYT